MTEDARSQQEAIADAVRDRVGEIPEESMEPQKRKKLLEIKQLEPEELGGLLMEAAAGRFQHPSLLQILDECANELMRQLELSDNKSVKLRTEGGMATLWHFSVGSDSKFFACTAKQRPDGRYAVHGLFFDNGDNEWSVEEVVQFAEPMAYVKRCLVDLGIIEDDGEEESPEP